jgi:signal transduction histidine kinase
VILPRAQRVGVFALTAFLLLIISVGELEAQPQIERLPIDLPVTNGLIRWWPNLFDVRDEITRQEGVVMGVLPPVAAGEEDETEFNAETGWVQLQPAITNEVFTLSFWVRWHPNELYVRILAQEDDQGDWVFQTQQLSPEFMIGHDHFRREDLAEQVLVSPGVWHHVCVARRTNGTSRFWVDGLPALEGRLAHRWPTRSRWLTVGNVCRGGDQEFRGSLRDLCAFDRVLDDSEVRALHGGGLPHRPARGTAARLAATGRSISLVMSTNATTALSRDWMHHRFTTEDGLPGNQVKAVLQAHDGSLWVGTEAGLARFDGRKFRAFTSENTPALKAIGQTVWSLSEDADGTIWAGIFGGLLRIRNLEFTAFTNGLPQRFVLQAEPVGDGSLWVAGFNDFVPRGPCWLRRYYPDSGKAGAEVIVPGHPRKLILMSKGMWIAAEQPQRIYFWDGDSSTVSAVAAIGGLGPTIQIANREGLASEAQVRCWQHPDSVSNWWMEVNLGPASPGFSWTWDPRIREPRLARSAGPAAADPWWGIFYNLARVHSGVLERIPIGEEDPGPEVTCVCANREGGIWFGTEEDGLHLMQERLVRVYTTKDGLNGNDVRSVGAAPDGGLWAGTSQGLSRWIDGHWRNDGPGKVRGLTVDREGCPWFGLAEFSPTAIRCGRRWFAVALGLEWQDPNSLLVSEDGKVWVACERGLSWFEPTGLELDSQEHLLPNPASPKPVFGRYAVGKELPSIGPLGLVEGRDGSIWMGTTADGLYRLRQGRFEHFSKRDGLAGDYCVPVYLDPGDALWIVGEGGLTRYREGRFQKATETDGLPKDVFLDLREDDLHNFWISGKRGIHRIARSELEDVFAGRATQVRSLTLGLRDGLLTPECSGLHYSSMAKTPDGHIWVATRNGLASFDPHQVKFDTQPLASVIEQLVVNRQEISGLAERTGAHPLQLPPGSGQRLEVHYSATSLTAADRVRFRYRLDGYENEWSEETDLRLAFYTNLRPGTYHFHVKAANAHGIWNDQDTSLGFVIRPFFWQTTPFYVGTACALALVAGAAHWRRMVAQRRLQEARHQQAITSEKARIAADMHDELGAALTQIAILGEVAKGQSGNEVQTRSTLDRISQSARDVTSRISDLVWATNPRNDTLDNLVAYLREHAASEFENTSIQPRLHFPPTLPDRSVSATFRRNLLLVLKESLNNILKYAQAREVAVRLQASDSHLELWIADDGRGFDPARSEATGNGLGNMRKRVEDLGGEFRLTSAPGKGTQVHVRVPLQVQTTI